MNDFIKSALPWLATALGGPFAGLATEYIGDKLGVPKATVETIKSTLNGLPPEKVVELKEVDYAFQSKMVELGYDSIYKLEQLNAQVLIEVNKTMQAEANSEHWPSYSWRPFIGFMFGLYIASMFILPLFNISPVKLDSDMILAIGGILGVASWFRGKAQANPEIQNTPTISQKG